MKNKTGIYSSLARAPKEKTLSFQCDVNADLFKQAKAAKRKMKLRWKNFLEASLKSLIEESK